LCLLFVFSESTKVTGFAVICFINEIKSVRSFCRNKINISAFLTYIALIKQLAGVLIKNQMCGEIGGKPDQKRQKHFDSAQCDIRL
jgi:hypothetical protein